MRIVMMGTGPFAVPTFEALIESAEHSIPLLVTRPVPPARGRRKTTVNPMRDLAESREIPTVDPLDVNQLESQEMIRSVGADLLVVCDYGQILSKATLALTPLGGINLHGSLLPRYRGAAPVNWTIMQGESEAGITVIHMTPGLDAGPALAIRSTPIGLDEDAATLERRLSQLGIEAVMDSIDLLATWDQQSAIGEEQDPALATKAPRLKKSDGQVDWQMPAALIANRVRGLKPWPGSYSSVDLHGKPLRVILDRVRVVDENDASQIAVPAAEPGSVVLADKSNLWIATGDGFLAIEQIQPAGKKSMPIADFLRGHAMNGLRFA